MNNLTKAILCIFLIATASAAYSTTSNVTKITTVVVQGPSSSGLPNKACVYLQDVPTDKCSTTGRYCMDISTEVGKAMLSTALTAHAAQTDVRIAGTGTCDGFDGSEGISWIMSIQ